MIKVIETNLSIKPTVNSIGEIMDFQSRVIEFESWESLINEIKNQETVIRNSCIGHLSGCTIPRNSVVYNLHIEDKTIDCCVRNYAGQVTRKLFYRV